MLFAPLLYHYKIITRKLIARTGVCLQNRPTRKLTLANSRVIWENTGQIFTSKCLPFRSSRNRSSTQSAERRRLIGNRGSSVQAQTPQPDSPSPRNDAIRTPQYCYCGNPYYSRNLLKLSALPRVLYKRNKEKICL